MYGPVHDVIIRKYSLQVKNLEFPDDVNGENIKNLLSDNNI